ncbi:MAG: dephospho-CoA kinase [Verrucomicrobiota bacterium]
MKVVGLTGGVGMGKSNSARLLRLRSIPVVDTDDLARQVVEPGQSALAEVQRVFGAEIVGQDGHLRREELARRVFSDPAARKRLEDILHPRIRALWRAQMEVWRAEGRSLAVVVIPLLFETSAEAELDATICIACTRLTQHQRLLDRGWSPADIEQRVRAQWPIEIKMARADYVVWTEANLDVHADQLNRILTGLIPA